MFRHFLKVEWGTVMKLFGGRRIGLAVFMVAALLAAACSSTPKNPTRQASPSIEVGADGGQVSAGDMTVVLPAGSVAGSGQLVVTRRALTVDPPDGVDVLGAAGEVTLNGATLTGQARVTFAVPSDVDGVNAYPVVVWEDGQGGWRWLPSEWTPGAPTITASLDHFSIGFLGKIDVGKWARDRAEEVKNYATGRSGVGQPSCGDEAVPRNAGVTVDSDGGDTVKWCFGKDQGKQVLRIANNRRAYTQVSFPDTWQVVDGGSFGLSLDAVNRTVSTGLADIAKGRNVRVLAGGSTMTFAVPEGSSGTATAEISMYAWLFSGMQLGVDVYAAVASRAGGTLSNASPNSWDRIVKRLIGAEPIGGYEDALQECTRALTDNVTDSPYASSATASAGKPLLKAAWGCIPSVMQADMNDTGARMFGLGAVLAAVGAIVGTILTATHLIVTGLREIWDSFATIGGRSIPIYDIRVVSPRRLGPADLLSAPVPSLCEHPAGTLVDGKLPGAAPNLGGVWLAWANKREASTVALGDLDGKPGDEIAAVINCNRGGVGWPDSVLIYGPGPTLMTTVVLRDIVPDMVGRARVYDITYRNGGLFIRWVTGQSGDLGCCSSMDAQALVRLSGGKLVVENIKSFPERPVVDRVLAAVTASDRAALLAFAGGKADIADSLARLRNGSTGFGSVKCHGYSRDAAGNVTTRPVFDLTGVRICDVEREGATTAYIAMGGKYTGDGDWQVVGVLPR